jgi:phosphatidylserine decarboxylase
LKAIKNTLLYILIVLLPKNLVSQIIGMLASWKPPHRLAVFINRSFARCFNIDVSEAEKKLSEYKSLQEFFIRRLKPGVRPIDPSANAIISPCDARLSEAGEIVKGKLIQFKGRLYTLQKLLGSKELADKFDGGIFATLYLSPRDYHRFHMPISGRITETIYFPGALWPVNPWSVAHIKDLFCVNERVISMISPDESNKRIAHIAVGATLVGKIKLSYNDLESNGDFRECRLVHEGAKQVHLKKGDELGLFMFGSTIILLFERGLIDSLKPSRLAKVSMGELIASKI